jgi:cellulose biosynthesis protein BcsQ/nucleotide-binding universal stress UspA family protein
MGKIITFFSYKGGVGRSMALANVGVLLAQWGHRVLMVDWDLEAPGLENFLRRYADLEQVLEKRGVLDLLIRDPKDAAEVAERTDWADFVTPIALTPSLPGTLHLMSAGRRDTEYYQKVRGLDIQTLYSSKAGGHFIETLRDSWRETYDFVLVDSRTGVTDIGGICTVQLPDLLVLVFTATEQAFLGSLEIAKRSAAARQRLPYERLRVPAVPVPSRFDTQTEFELSQQWLDRFARELAPLYVDWLPSSISRRDVLEVTKLPYMSYFSFGEGLPVIEQGTNDPAGLGYAYENLAALIATDLQDVELLLEDRDDFIKKAQVRTSKAKTKILVLFSHEDQEWVDLLSKHLGVSRGSHALELWSDREIAVGYGWHDDLQEAFRTASVVILMISSAFLSSGFITRDELVRLTTAPEHKNLPVVPIIIGPAAWQSIPWLARRTALPSDGQPLALGSSETRDLRVADAATEIRYLVEARENLASSSFTREVTEVDGVEPLIRTRGQHIRKSKSKFDVFLSYNARDKQSVIQLAEALKDRGLRVWLDDWELLPGQPWQQVLESAIASTEAAVVVVGKGGIGPWQNREMRAVLAEFIQRGSPVIPVLLPEAGASENQNWPLFLSQLTWLDLRDGVTNDGLDRLEWGITGRRPRRAS